MQVAKTKGLSAILTSEGRSLLRTLEIEYGIFLMSNNIKVRYLTYTLSVLAFRGPSNEQSVQVRCK